MNINQLKGFVLIVQKGNLTQAAKKLFISQPAMTKLIHQLEDELETELFNRQGRVMRLNSAGKLFYPYANCIIEQWQNGIDALKTQNESRIDPIKLHAQVASSLIPEIIEAIRRIFPKTPIQLNQRITQISNIHEFDFIISNQPVTEDDQTFTSIPLFEEEIFVGGVNNYITKKEITIAEISKLPLISMGLHTPLRDDIDLYFKNLGYKLNYQFEADDPGTVKELLLNGFGIGFIPAISWQNLCQKLNLARIIPNTFTRTIYLNFSKSSNARRNTIIAKNLKQLFAQRTDQPLQL